MLCNAANSPGLDPLQMICDAVNNSQANWVPEFRRLIAAWLQSGPDLEAMLKADVELKQNLMEVFRVLYWPTKGRRAHLLFSPHGDPRDKNSTARAMFMTVTLSPECERFCGPCPRTRSVRTGEQCGRHFIAANEGMKRFCSSSCARAARTIETRGKEHAEKLGRARVAIAKWKQDRLTTLKWKAYVCESHKGITPKFLTRAVNKGELQPPTEKSRLDRN